MCVCIYMCLILSMWKHFWGFSHCSSLDTLTTAMQPTTTAIPTGNLPDPQKIEGSRVAVRGFIQIPIVVG